MLSPSMQADLAGNAFSQGVTGALRALIFNPGFSVVTRYRLARRWHKASGIRRVISRLSALSNAQTFGCYLAPSARIGAGLILPHPVGIVVGEGCCIGSGVTLYQNVTIGRREVTEEFYPSIGNAVTIFAGAVIVGGVGIGEGATVGANAVVMSDIPAGTVAVGAPARVISAGARQRN